jgi:hypothetical protein
VSVGFCVDKTNPFNEIFIPVANRFASSLQDKKISVYDAGVEKAKDGVRIIFGSHANPAYWLINRKQKDIFVNFEPIFLSHWKHKNKTYLDLLEASNVLDYTNKNLKFKDSFKLFHLPPLFISNKINSNLSDVLFVGSFNDLRQKKLQKLSEKKISLNLKFKIFGDTLLYEIQKSKIFLNLNFEDQGSVFNLFRFCLCARTNTLYAGESGDLSDYPEMNELVGISLTSNNISLTKLITELLGDKDKFKKALEIQHKIASILEKKYQNFIDEFSRQIS